MYYNPGHKSAYLDGIKTRFEHLLNTLERLKIEYDLASENIMKHHGRIAGDAWVIGERRYQTVVIPEYCESIDQDTFVQLQSYLQNGGRLLAAGDLPVMIDGRDSRLLSGLFDRHKGQIQTLRGDIRPFTMRHPGLEPVGFRPVDPLKYGGEVYHMRRVLDDGQLIFLSNFSKDETARIVFEASGKSAFFLNLFDGTARSAPVSSSDAGVAITIELPPAGSSLVLVSNREAASPLMSGQNPDRQWIPVSTSATSITAGPNVLSLDFVELELDGGTYEDLYFADAANLAFQRNGLKEYGRFGYNPWAVAVQYRTNILDMAGHFGAGSGFKVAYPFVLAQGFVPDSLQAVVEWPHLYEISVNGTPVTPVRGEWWLDPSFGIFDLTPYLMEGSNQIQLEVAPMNIHAEIEPVFILGDFQIKPAGKGFILGPADPPTIGSWAAQDRGMFSDAMAYTKSFEASRGGCYKVQLGNWNGTVARVRVNGKLAGHIFHQPYELEITDAIQSGDNTITVEVVGSLKGLLGPHHRDREPGFVTPWSWMIGPSSQPPGEAYHLPDYGLFEDFRVLSLQ